MLLSTVSAILAAVGLTLVRAQVPSTQHPSTWRHDSKNARQHTLESPYVSDDLKIRYFDYGGDAIINTAKHIRLTRDAESQQGWVWNKLPLVAPNWQTEFAFRVATQKSHRIGDGFAFWLTTERMTPGPVFGSKDLFTGLGIFFDTYTNGPVPHALPYVMAMMGDGKTHYDLMNDGKKNAIASCEADLLDLENDNIARVKYFRSGKYLELNLKYRGEWHKCFALNNITLPSFPYMGFSALTGDIHDAHDLIYVRTNLLSIDGHVTPPPNQQAAPAGHAKANSSGWGFLRTFLLIVGCLVVLGVAFVVFRMSTKANPKKF